MRCEMQIKADDRLNTFQCPRLDALPARLTCPRLGHVENLNLCTRCLRGISYCEECLKEDHVLARLSLVLVSR